MTLPLYFKSLSLCGCFYFTQRSFLWQYAVISLTYTQGGKRKLTLIRREGDVVIMPHLLSLMDEVSSSKLLIHNFVPNSGLPRKGHLLCGFIILTRSIQCLFLHLCILALWRQWCVIKGGHSSPSLCTNSCSTWKSLVTVFVVNVVKFKMSQKFSCIKFVGRFDWKEVCWFKVQSCTVYSGVKSLTQQHKALRWGDIFLQ